MNNFAVSMFVAVSLLAPACAQDNQQSSGDSQVERFLRGASPFMAGEESGISTEAGSLNRLLEESTAEELFRVVEDLRAECFATLTSGPERAALQAEERELRRRLAQLKLGVGNVSSRIEAERRQLEETIGRISRIYQPGTDQFKQAVTREVERRKPRLETLLMAAEACPVATVQLESRLARVILDRRYFDFLGQHLKDSNDADMVATWVLAASATWDVAGKETAGGSTSTMTYEEASDWIEKLGVQTPSKLSGEVVKPRPAVAPQKRIATDNRLKSD